MINLSVYTKQYIQNLSKMIKADINLVERSLFAFGLLEALVKVELPFIFKGGTCLMLLLEEPKRLSTDIDIIVNPTVNISNYLIEAGKIFPFKYMEENIRKGRNNIEKRHFRFYYDSPIQQNDTNILLDVVFETNPYSKTITKEIKNMFILTDEKPIFVTIPSIDCILGDKLTAFAPHSTGIPFFIDKELEIIKQLNDISCLFDNLNDLTLVNDTYNKTVKLETGFRGLNINREDCLKDTIRACLSIISKGSLLKEDYQHYLTGIRKIRGHMLGYKYNPDIAANQAAKTLYLCACLLSNNNIDKNIDEKLYKNTTKFPDKLKSLFYIKKLNAISFSYLCESMRLINLEELL